MPLKSSISGPVPRDGYSVRCLVILLLSKAMPVHSIVHIQHVAPISQLHRLVIGLVLPCCGEEYERRRLVNNKACQARPAVIVRPATSEDVAITISFARRATSNYLDGRTTGSRRLVAESQGRKQPPTEPQMPE